jgi:hypothetical protein
MRKRIPVTTVAMAVVAVLCMGAACQDQIKTAMEQTTIILGKSLVKTWGATKEFVESKEGSVAMCDDIIDKYADPKYSDEEALQGTDKECKERIEKFETEFRAAYTSAGSALESLEHVLDLWESADKKQKLESISNALLAVKDLVRCLESAKVPIPDYLSEALSYIEGLANTIKEL